MSNEWFALIHKPISYQKAMQIEDARKAINKEWDKLEGYPAWKSETVQEKEQIVKEAKATRLKNPDHQIHLARLIVLCHLKNAQLDETFWPYKGRIVL